MFVNLLGGRREMKCKLAYQLILMEIENVLELQLSHPLKYIVIDMGQQTYV